MEFYWRLYLWARSESHKLIRFLSKYLLQVKQDEFNNPDWQGLKLFQR